MTDPVKITIDKPQHYIIQMIPATSQGCEPIFRSAYIRGRFSGRDGLRFFGRYENPVEKPAED